MDLKRVGTQFNRVRAGLNENFDKIEGKYKGLQNRFDNVVEEVSEKAFDKVVDRAKIDWLPPVDTFDDLATTYPDATEGQTVMTRDTGKIYRMTDGVWMEIQDIDPTAINEVDTRLSALLSMTDGKLGDIKLVPTEGDSLSEKITNELLDDYCNVHWFKSYVPDLNVVSDPGGADWTEAFKKAIEFMKQYKIKVLKVPLGRYLIKDTLELTDIESKLCIKVEGRGMTGSDESIDNVIGTTFVFNPDDREKPLFHFRGVSEALWGAGGLEGLKIIGWGIGVLLENVDHHIFRNLRVGSGLDVGIKLLNSTKLGFTEFNDFENVILYNNQVGLMTDVINDGDMSFNGNRFNMTIACLQSGSVGAWFKRGTYYNGTFDFDFFGTGNPSDPSTFIKAESENYDNIGFIKIEDHGVFDVGNRSASDKFHFHGYVAVLDGSSVKDVGTLSISGGFSCDNFKQGMAIGTQSRLSNIRGTLGDTPKSRSFAKPVDMLRRNGPDGLDHPFSISDYNSPVLFSMARGLGGNWDNFKEHFKFRQNGRIDQIGYMTTTNFEDESGARYSLIHDDGLPRKPFILKRREANGQDKEPLTVYDNGAIRHYAYGTSEGDLINNTGHAAGTGFRVVGVYDAREGGENESPSAMRVRRNSQTQRSISAAGTINATGADYAEYVFKEIADDVFEKGEVCGVNSEGKLTKSFSRSRSFVVKSTEPSYVGNDIWSRSLGDSPLPPNENDFIDHEAFQEAVTQYESELEVFEKALEEYLKGERKDRPVFEMTMPRKIDYFNQSEFEEAKKQYGIQLELYNERLETERQKVDRIAFSGQVPCLVDGAVAAGDYIIVEQTPKDRIKAKAIPSSDITFEQYKNAVGQVWSVIDGKVVIAVGLK